MKNNQKHNTRSFSLLHRMIGILLTAVTVCGLFAPAFAAPTAVTAAEETITVEKNDTEPGSTRAAESGEPQYLTFSSDKSFTIRASRPKWEGTVWYSTDTVNWTVWRGSKITAGLSNGKYSLYFRGKGNTVISGRATSYGSVDSCPWTISGTEVACHGNIMTLLDWENPDTAVMGKAAFADMFACAECLTSAPELPAMTLASNCYSYMFIACTGLTSCPELPATTLASNCYDSMFFACTGLTSCPELPATTLASNCYSYMFYRCTGLTSCPELPAMTLASCCYNFMFSGCEGLTEAPELPATTLDFACYADMFAYCTGLVSAPELPATTLATACYAEMFIYCTGLVLAPELPATTLAESCYDCMFSNCTSLTTPPALPATELKACCYYGMFMGCTNLEVYYKRTSGHARPYSIPEMGFGTDAENALTDMFAGTGGDNIGTPDINTTYYLPGTVIDDYIIFYSDKAFTISTASPKWEGTVWYSTDRVNWTEWDGSKITAGSITFETGARNYCIFFAGKDNTRISSSDKGVISQWVITGNNVYCSGNIMTLLDWENPEDAVMGSYAFYNMFMGCRSLVSSPILPATVLSPNCYCAMFSGCKNLKYAPSLPATELAAKCYDSMFMSCTSLEWAPELRATTLAEGCYSAMFAGCQALTEAPGLPATQLKENCYSQMFYSCKSLAEAPALPATQLADYCYYRMFDGCTSLCEAPALPATVAKPHCYEYMFRSCYSLKFAPELQAKDLAEGCYYGMFMDCINLIKAPVLPATELKAKCYYRMFYGCTKLELCYRADFTHTVAYSIPGNGNGINAEGALTEMFTKTGGDDIGTPDINTEYYTRY